MAVLKRHQTAPTLGGAVVMELADLKEEGERLIAAARLESERLLREARIESTRLRAEAVDAGRAEGLEEGRREGEALGRAEGEAAAREEALRERSTQLDDLAGRWNDALDRWESLREQILRASREETLRLAIAIAERVVRRAVAARPESAVERLEGALELLGRAAAVTVACAPGDRELLAEAMPALVERLGRTLELTFVADAELARGDVVVRVAEGAVDASLATQIDRIAEALLPGGPGGPGGSGDASRESPERT